VIKIFITSEAVFVHWKTMNGTWHIPSRDEIYDSSDEEEQTASKNMMVTDRQFQTC
jgi:hypothetical protein